jgi:hypothetical protein
MFQRRKKNKNYAVAGEISFLPVRLVFYFFIFKEVAWRSCCDVAVKGKKIIATSR